MKETFEHLLNLAADITGVRSLPDVLSHPSDDVTLGLRGLYQTQPHTCGAVAGLMVLHYFKPRTGSDAFFQSVNPTEADGTSTCKLVRALRRHGLRVQVRLDMTFADFVAAIDQDRPVLVTVKTRERKTQHWVVVYGYGRRPQRLFLAGTGLPLVSQKQYGWAEFRRKWADKGAGLVCGRRSPKPKAKAKPAILKKKGLRK